MRDRTPNARTPSQKKYQTRPVKIARGRAYFFAAASLASRRMSCRLLKAGISAGLGVAVISRLIVSEMDLANVDAELTAPAASFTSTFSTTAFFISWTLWSVRSAKRWNDLLLLRVLTTTSFASQFATRWTKGFDMGSLRRPLGYVLAACVVSCCWCGGPLTGPPAAVMACKYLALQEGVLGGALVNCEGRQRASKRLASTHDY